jgi:hypothetical protein
MQELPEGGSQQAASQQQTGSQQSGSSSQGTVTQPPGQQAMVPSGPSAQAPESQSLHAGTERTPGAASAVPARAQVLPQQQVHITLRVLVKFHGMVSFVDVALRCRKTGIVVDDKVRYYWA